MELKSSNYEIFTLLMVFPFLDNGNSVTRSDLTFFLPYKCLMEGKKPHS